MVMPRCFLCGIALDTKKIRCGSCGQWNVNDQRSTTPTVPSSAAPAHGPYVPLDDGTYVLSKATAQHIHRLQTGPWDCVFGEGGIACGSAVILGGAPGAGKTTLLLQIADSVVCQSRVDAMYISTEESGSQVLNTALRLSVKRLDRIRFVPLLEGFDRDIEETVIRYKPSIVILDSLQGMTGIDQDYAVEICGIMKRAAATLNIPIIMTCQVTKRFDFGGLMAMQHAVDTLLMFSPRERGKAARCLSALKNRFGAETDICLQMTARGIIECPGCTHCTD